MSSTRVHPVQADGLSTTGPEGQEITGVRIHSRRELTPQAMAEMLTPLWEQARAGGRNLVRVRRGWLGGPHVEASVVGESAPVAWGSIATQLQMPQWQANELEPAEYLATARQRGRLEAVEPPYLPYRQHGERVLVRAESTAELPTARRLRQVVEAILAPATMQALNTVAADPEKAGQTLAEILTVVASAHPMGAGFGAFSLRSHAEALMLWGGQPDARRRTFTTRYQQQSELFTDIVQNIKDGAGSPLAWQWTKQLAYAAGTVDHCVQRGELTDADVDELSTRPAEKASAQQQQEHPDTEFHRIVYGSNQTEGAGRWFAGYRLLVNSVYAQLPLLGVSPLQRAFTCWAIAEAIDEVEGMTWTERLKDGI